MHALWKGSLSFGLVNIPVNMYTLSRERELSFVLFHKKDHSTIRYRRICEAENKEVQWNEIEKGYQIEKGNYIVLDEKDFKKANLKKTSSIEIESFVNENEVDTIYYCKPYFLEPSKTALKAYSLLRDALKKTGKVGIAKFVLHHKEHIGVVKVYGNALIINQLRYKNELHNVKMLNIESAKWSSKEMDTAIQLIDQLSGKFAPEEYKDTYIEELKKTIKKKAKGKAVISESKDEAPKSTKVQDIIPLLQASLKAQKKQKKRRHVS